MSKKQCGTCAFASFGKTPTGRVRRKAGLCGKPAPVVEASKIPASISIEMRRAVIWPDDGADCPTWSPT